MDAVLTTQAVPSASSFEICVLGSCPFAEAMSKHFICWCSREDSLVTAPGAWWCSWGRSSEAEEPGAASLASRYCADLPLAINTSQGQAVERLIDNI